MANKDNSKSQSHPDALYLKQAEIGGVIAKGMAVTFKANPKNPIDFFAKWLLQQSESAKAEMQAVENEAKRKEMMYKYKEHLKTV